MAAHHAPPRSRTNPFRAALLALASTLLLAAARDAVAHPGQWSSRNHRDSIIQVHMVLARDGSPGSPYHSRILTFQGQQATGSDGEEIGWQPGPDSCGTGAWNQFTFDPLWSWVPGAKIFCDGHAHLADGGLLSAGGDDEVNDRGIRDARTYQASGSQAGTWTARAKMNRERFYPTVTALRDGRAIAVGGARSPQLWVFGGRREGSPPSGATGHQLHRLGRATDGIWDLPAITPDYVGNDRPEPREGHTAVRLTEGVRAQVVFGGKDGSGNTVDPFVWLLTRSTGGPSETTANDYTYQWTKRTTGLLQPSPRCDHVALANEPTKDAYKEMVIYGGVHKPAGGPDSVLAEFWRLYRNPQQTWVWEPVDEFGSSGSGPGARYGHAAVYHAKSRRMFLFGGSSETTGGPTNNDVWVFTFHDATFLSGTWSPPLSVAGTPPGARLDHTLVIDPDTVTVINPPNTPPNTPPITYDLSLFVFGGVSPNDTTHTLWKLNVLGNTGSWSKVNATGVPARRAGHAAYYDNAGGAQRMYIFGGEPTSATELDTCVYSYKLGSPAWSKGAQADARLSGLTMDIDPFDGGFEVPYARLPEIYAPGTGGSPGNWALQTNSGLASSLPEQYPVQFLVPGTSIPGGGGRLMQVGPDALARYLDLPLAGTTAGGWQTVSNGNSGFNAWSGVVYGPGKILIAGGKINGALATGTTRTLDASGTAGWRPQLGMEPRYNHTLLVLPTGQVFATGGIGAGPVFRDPQYCPQIWTPSAQGDTGSWTAPGDLVCDDVVRDYHSSALLLPDGRILTGGGNDSLTSRQDLRLYCPPYLFNALGNLAARPEITSAPTSLVYYGESFVIGKSSDPIASVCLIRPGAVTHSFDQNGRYVPLTFETLPGGTQLRAVAPVSGSVAPPGDYLLFILNTSGVPAIARWIRLGNCAQVPCDSDSPPQVSDLYVDMVSPTEMLLVWTAPGDHVTPPKGAFDLRFASAPIANEVAYAAATPDENEPAVELPGTPINYTKQGLTPCTQYSFALKTRDSTYNWSPLSNQITETTTCGGGGGGGYSAQGAAGQGGEGAPSAAAEAGASGEPPATRTLVAQTRRLADGGWQVSLHFATEADGLDPAATAITVDRQSTSGDRETLGQFTPEATTSLLGLCSLRERGRVAIPGVERLEAVLPHLRSRSQDYVLASAQHSRLGALGDRFVAGGGNVDLVSGDVLELTYQPATETLTDAAGWYLLVNRVGNGTPIPFSRRPAADASLPLAFALGQNEPNPTGASTIIRFDLPVASSVRLEVFDLLGRKVATLADGRYAAGYQALTWDLRDASGSAVRPGVYLYRMEAGDFRARRKMSVLP